MSMDDRTHEPCTRCDGLVMTNDTERATCDDYGDWYHRGCYDEHCQDEAERAFERSNARLMESPPESYESLQAKARLLK